MLDGAPEEIRALLHEPLNVPIMLKCIYRERGSNKVNLGLGPVLYADEEELTAMEECHERCLEILRTFLDYVGDRSTFRALDVAGGDGRLSASLLLN